MLNLANPILTLKCKLLAYNTSQFCIVKMGHSDKIYELEVEDIA